MLANDEILQGRYRIVRQLGQGGMGAIYVAEDKKRFGKLVALKEILIGLAKIPNPKQRENVRRAFEREAKILTQLEHDAFPQVIDYFLETERQFLVMELVHGEDLGELLERHQNPFPLKDVLRWTEQLLDALDYLHTLTPPIIHRDIKPQNLKLTKRGKIKLLDFGIATGSDAQIHTTITTHTFIAATQHYSPLEQIIKVLDANHREFLEQKFGERLTRIIYEKTTPAADIYALGATLYHLLTGQLPVDALKRMLEIWTGKPDPMPSPHEANPNISPEISNWILGSMAIERENRFASAVETQGALDEIISGGKRREEEENRRRWLEEHEELNRERELFKDRENIETARLVDIKQIEEELRFSQADTLPDENQESLPKTAAPEIAVTYPAITTPSITAPSADLRIAVEEEKESEPESEPSIEESKSVDYMPARITESSLPAKDTLIDEKEGPVFVETPREENPFVGTVSPNEPKKKTTRILPVAAIVLLLLGGAGLAAIFMFNNSNATNSNNNVANTTVIAPTSSPGPEPTTAPSNSPTNSPTQIGSNNEIPKPDAAPSKERTIQPQGKTPVKKTPIPARTPDNSPDCVYNGRCKN